jgi:hypothetical protein
VRGVFRLGDLMTTLRITQSEFRIAIFDESEDSIALGVSFVYSNLKQNITEI